MGCVTGIQRVVLAAFAPIASIGGCHFKNRYLGVLQVTQQPSPISLTYFASKPAPTVTERKKTGLCFSFFYFNGFRT